MTISKFEFLNRFFPRKKLKDRVKELEKQVINLEKASYISVNIKCSNFFDTWRQVGVNEVLGELLEKLGYKMTYGEEVTKKTWIKEKSLKK